MFSFFYACWIIYKTVMFGDPVAGFPSLKVVILFLGGVQLVAIGILGEYLGRMFNEVKRRPLYLLNQFDASSLATGPSTTSCFGDPTAAVTTSASRHA